MRFVLPASIIVLCLGSLSLAARPGPAMRDRTERAQEPTEAAEASEETPEAQFSVSGYGRVFGNLILKRNVMSALRTDEPRETFSANFVETALFLINSKVMEDGYRNASFGLVLEDASGGPAQRIEWQPGNLLNVDSEDRFSAVHVYVDEGTYYYFDTIEFDGLVGLDPSEARDFFYPADYLLGFSHLRAYSETKLDSGLANLAETIRQDGYRQVAVNAQQVRVNDETGAVDVMVQVAPGPKTLVRNISYTWPSDKPIPEAFAEEFAAIESGDRPYSRFAVASIRRDFLNVLYRRGYADASVEIGVSPPEAKEGTDLLFVDLRAKVEPGPVVRVGQVRFEGAGKTNMGFLRDRFQIEPGDRLSPVELDEARNRLGGYGIFRTIRVKTGDERVDSAGRVTRDVIVELEERDRLSIHLLVGYGTYEQLRAGFEIDQRNLWGIAHSQKLLFVQSFKSTRLEYEYRMPDVIWRELSAFFETNYLYREEISFDRVEYGSEVRLETSFGIPNSRFGTGFRVGRLQSQNFVSDSTTRPEEDPLTDAVLGSMFVFHSRNTLDNIIYPTRGYQYRIETEYGEGLFGDDVGFASVTGNFSTVFRLSRDWLYYVGLSSGVISELADNDIIPLNRRYFLGGENSIRGWRQGEAAPVDADGNVIGAEAFTLLQMDLEYFLLPNFSVAVFTDNLIMSEDAGDWPGDTWLGTVGVGFRYKTFIGPLRLDFGYNFEKRDFDDDFMIQFGLGYPF